MEADMKLSIADRGNVTLSHIKGQQSAPKSRKVRGPNKRPSKSPLLRLTQQRLSKSSTFIQSEQDHSGRDIEIL